MGKVSPQSIKYIVNAKFGTEGVVEKPDVIGAIFGQTEGLLGEELELRELQKMGKIGRINVELEVNESKTQGTIEIPTSIDKAETTIIAAAIETIDRIGPCDASFQITSIEDVRSSKREFIVERAKKLLEKFNTSSPKLRDIEQDVMNYAKTAKICDYGRELLPAGPDIDSADKIVVVEGRADVLNLLRAGIRNAIAMNGTVIPRTVKELSKEKEVTLFVDGDRGGILITFDSIQNADIGWIARAPDGKEVEELTEKEIYSCLRNKMVAEEFIQAHRKGKKKKGKDKKSEKSQENIKAVLEQYLVQLDKAQSMLLLGNADNFRTKTISEAEAVKALYEARKKGMPIFGLITDSATQQLIKAAEQVNCSYVVARTFSATSDKVQLLSF